MTQVISSLSERNKENQKTKGKMGFELYFGYLIQRKSLLIKRRLPLGLKIFKFLESLLRFDLKGGCPLGY